MNTNLNNILFLDIETAPQYQNWNDVPCEMQKLYELKTKYQLKDDITIDEFYNRAGIWAEFGKIICISVGYFKQIDKIKHLRVTSFSSTNEKVLLLNFKELLEKHFSKPNHLLCAHNGKEFDFPFIARRMIINNIEIPKKLNLFGKKPWEVPHIDTLELWKFGDYKHYTSLKLLTYILGVPSPKQDINGSEVRDIYYNENDLQRIINYCERDTIAVAQLLLRFHNQPLINEKHIITI